LESLKHSRLIDFDEESKGGVGGAHSLRLRPVKVIFVKDKSIGKDIAQETAKSRLST
jgi:hypothetical protein